MAGGRGGCPPHKTKKRGRAAHISNQATSGTQNAGKPSAHGGGQMGVQGAKPPGGGRGGVSPHKTKKRGRAAHISNQATSGAQNLGEPSANGGGQRGVQGLVDVPPSR
jgi:hypothetical protein